MLLTIYSELLDALNSVTVPKEFSYDHDYYTYIYNIYRLLYIYNNLFMKSKKYVNVFFMFELKSGVIKEVSTAKIAHSFADVEGLMKWNFFFFSLHFYYRYIICLIYILCNGI